MLLIFKQDSPITDIFVMASSITVIPLSFIAFFLLFLILPNGTFESTTLVLICLTDLLAFNPLRNTNGCVTTYS